MTEKKRLANLLKTMIHSDKEMTFEEMAEYLLQNGIIVLSCNIGEIVYEIVPECKPPFGTCPFSGGYGINRCGTIADETQYKKCGAYIEEKEFKLCMYNRVGKSIFLTKQKAEAKLKY